MRRAAFTLFEVLLAMVIAVMVLAAVYTFLGYQLKQAQAGREVIERTTLARSILSRIDTDVRATIALNDPSRYRLAPDVSGDTAPAPTTTSTPSTASSPSTPSGSSSPTTAAPASNQTEPIELPLGVIGTGTELHLFVSRVPGEVFGNATGEAGLVTSDLRRISYWLGGKGGLCRMEVRLITSEQAGDLDLPTGDVDQYLYAGEVKSLEITYFDGTSWLDTWDSTTTGPDQATPIGSPRAISIKIGVMPQGAVAALEGKEPELKYYRHVIAIPTANGTPLNTNPEGGIIKP